MSAQLVAVIVQVGIATTNLPAGSAAYANTSVVVTDSSGVPQPAVLLTGAETPTPWAFQTSVNVGAGTVVATAMDANGVAIPGASVSQAFTEAGTPPPATFPSPTSITVTPVAAASALAAAAVKKA